MAKKNNVKNETENRGKILLDDNLFIWGIFGSFVYLRVRRNKGAYPSWHKTIFQIMKFSKLE